MSPGEFTLRIAALNSRGHLGIQFSFSDYRYYEGTKSPFALAAAFQIDPTSLSDIAAALQAGIQSQRTNVT